MSNPTFLSTLGSLALAHRLKRLGERLSQETASLYREHGFPFEPRWFFVFHELGLVGQANATEIAAHIGCTHTAVIQAANEMLRAGLVVESVATGDRRKRMLALSGEGQALFQRLQHLWKDLQGATDQVLQETGNELPGALDRLEAALDRLPIRDRLPKCVTLFLMDQVEVLPFSPSLHRGYREVLDSILDAQRFLKPDEVAALHSPGLKRNLKIFLACIDHQVAGCAVLRTSPKSAMEILLVGVLPSLRRRQVGRKLVLACLDEARIEGGKTLQARSGPGMEAATRLYRSLGFAYSGPVGSGDAVHFRCELKPH